MSKDDAAKDGVENVHGDQGGVGDSVIPRETLYQLAESILDAFFIWTRRYLNVESLHLQEPVANIGAPEDVDEHNGDAMHGYSDHANGEGKIHDAVTELVKGVPVYQAKDPGLQNVKVVLDKFIKTLVLQHIHSRECENVVEKTFNVPKDLLALMYGLNFHC